MQTRRRRAAPSPAPVAHDGSRAPLFRAAAHADRHRGRAAHKVLQVRAVRGLRSSRCAPTNRMRERIPASSKPSQSQHLPNRRSPGTFLGHLSRRSPAHATPRSACDCTACRCDGSSCRLGPPFFLSDVARRTDRRGGSVRCERGRRGRRSAELAAELAGAPSILASLCGLRRKMKTAAPAPLHRRPPPPPAKAAPCKRPCRTAP